MDYERMSLEQIEADVVIVLWHRAGAHIATRVCPIWECDKAPAALASLSAELALRYAEDCGCGFVDAEVIDFRVPPEA